MTKAQLMSVLLVLKDYVLARLNETSTWRGIVLMLAAFGVSISPDQMELIVTMGLFVSGAIGAIFGERFNSMSRSTDKPNQEPL